MLSKMWHIQNFCTVDGNVKWYNHSGESSGNKTKIIHLTSDPAIPFPGINAREMKTYIYAMTNSLIFRAVLFLIASN